MRAYLEQKGAKSSPLIDVTLKEPTPAVVKRYLKELAISLGVEDSYETKLAAKLRVKCVQNLKKFTNMSG